MKKALAIGGGVVGFLVGVVAYVLLMEVVFGSEQFSTKIGALFAIGGAIGGASLMDRITGAKKASTEAAAGGAEDRARQERLWEAVLRNDPEELEGLRDVIRPVDVGPLAARWKPSLEWPTKEALISLLTDRTAEKHPEIRPVVQDGLQAPTFEVRCYAYCSLTGDFDGFTAILQGGDAVLRERLQARGIA